MTSPTTTFSLNNNSGSVVYAYIVGRDYNTKLPLFIQADGKTVYYPVEPTERLQPLEADCAIVLNNEKPVLVTIPQMISGRVYFCLDSKLTFFLNPKGEDETLPGAGIVQPSVTDNTDLNYNLNWTFVEFTYDPSILFVNITYADWISWPISLQLRNTSGEVQTVQGLSKSGLDKICQMLVDQGTKDGADWSKVIVKGLDGMNLRVLSPNLAISMGTTHFKVYYEAYIDQVWEKYSNEDLTVRVDEERTTKGRVTNGLLTFDNGITVSKPSTMDIFSCSTGAFVETQGDIGVVNSIIAAAFNRSTLLINNNQPDGEDQSTFYKTDPTNHYSRIIHELNLDGRGYAFPYDDVRPSMAPDVSGSIFDANPDLLTITLSAPGN
ncbi:glycoside hydrolase family 64 protein [Camillea tinctor]|nr:glycoside hydrolase family 64 protein [Camillea tinctor]